MGLGLYCSRATRVPPKRRRPGRSNAPAPSKITANASSRPAVAGHACTGLLQTRCRRWRPTLFLYPHALLLHIFLPPPFLPVAKCRPLPDHSHASPRSTSAPRVRSPSGLPSRLDLRTPFWVRVDPRDLSCGIPPREVRQMRPAVLCGSSASVPAGLVTR